MIPRYTPKAFSELWSDKTRYGIWLDVELAACQAMETEGLVPKGTAASIRAKNITLDPAKIDEIERTTRHDVIAFLTHVEQLAGEPARWLHRGMTSSDVLDTSFAIQLARAADLLLERTDSLIAGSGEARQRARAYAANLLLARHCARRTRELRDRARGSLGRDCWRGRLRFVTRKGEENRGGQDRRRGRHIRALVASARRARAIEFGSQARRRYRRRSSRKIATRASIRRYAVACGGHRKRRDQRAPLAAQRGQ